MSIGILRLRDVIAKTGLKASTIYDGMAAGRFPRQFKLGRQAVGWVESEIEDWLRAKIAERDAKAARKTKPNAG